MGKAVLANARSDVDQQDGRALNISVGVIEE